MWKIPTALRFPESGKPGGSGVSWGTCISWPRLAHLEESGLLSWEPAFLHFRREAAEHCGVFPVAKRREMFQGYTFQDPPCEKAGFLG